MTAGGVWSPEESSFLIGLVIIHRDTSPTKKILIRELIRDLLSQIYANVEMYEWECVSVGVCYQCSVTYPRLSLRAEQASPLKAFICRCHSFVFCSVPSVHLSLSSLLTLSLFLSFPTLSLSSVSVSLSFSLLPFFSSSFPLLLQELGLAVSLLAQRAGRHTGGLFCNPAGHTTASKAWGAGADGMWGGGWVYTATFQPILLLHPFICELMVSPFFFDVDAAPPMQK